MNYYFLALRVGIEPTTPRASTVCSTWYTELPKDCFTDCLAYRERLHLYAIKLDIRGACMWDIELIPVLELVVIRDLSGWEKSSTLYAIRNS